MRTLRHKLVELYYKYKIKRIVSHLNKIKKPNLNDWMLYVRKEIEKLKTPAPKALVQPIVDDKVNGLIVSAKEVNSKNVILYFHGGGYFFGSPDLYIINAYNLAIACNATVYLIDYRMVPESTCVDTLKDAEEAYAFLLRSGIEPKNISFGGDSAGGGLTLALLFLLRDKNIPLPSSTFLISPWVDLLFSTEYLHLNNDKDYVLLPTKLLKEVVEVYRGNLDAANPLISPFYGNFDNLPPLIVQSGADESLVDENKLLVEKIKSVNKNIEHEIWPDMPHIFQFLPLPEAKVAINKIGKFVQNHFG